MIVVGLERSIFAEFPLLLTFLQSHMFGVGYEVVRIFLSAQIVIPSLKLVDPFLASAFWFVRCMHPALFGQLLGTPIRVQLVPESIEKSHFEAV